MKNNNVFKPRYKIAFQAKSKIWPYKNSRMRRFFNIRGRKLIRRGYFKRYVLVFNNMKWAIARRYVKPYLKRRYASRIRRYRTSFYTKQQLRHFYGKVKESYFRVFFRNNLISIARRNNSFFSMLERRLDMVVFRMRFLPTIFASNQMIQHYGINVNKTVERSPNAIVKLGDVISLPKAHWSAIYYNMFTRIFYKVYGKYILKCRMFKTLRKKVWWIKKAKRFKRKYISWVRKKSRFLRYFKNIRLKFEYFYQKMKMRLLQYNNFYKIKQLKKIFRHCEEFEKASVLKELNQKVYQENFSEEDFKMEVILNKFKEVFVKTIKKLTSWIKKKKILIYKWRWKKTYAYMLKNIALCLNVTSLLNYFWMRIRMEELRIYSRIVLKLIIAKKKNQKYEKIENENTLKILKILKDREIILKQKYVYVQKNLSKYYFYILKKKLKKFKANIGWRKHYLIYFLLRRKYKKENKKRVIRLKAYHWYIPKYIYFNFQTMSGMLIGSPVAKDIFYPFRCSLSKIYSFYKSRGY